jgi:hypothetical protein
MVASNTLKKFKVEIILKLYNMYQFSQTIVAIATLIYKIKKFAKTKQKFKNIQHAHGTNN